VPVAFAMAFDWVEDPAQVPVAFAMAFDWVAAATALAVDTTAVGVGLEWVALSAPAPVHPAIPAGRMVVSALAVYRLRLYL
jgi:hypothetical protein